MRVFIASNRGSASRVVLNTVSKKFGSTVFENAGDSARVNALAVLNATMEEIIEKDVKGIHVFYAPGVVADAVQQGYFKYWLATGKNSKGEELDKTEIALWENFAELYSKMFLSAVVKNIKSASLPQGRRFKVTAEQEQDNLLQAKAWDNLPKVAETAEVENEDELFA